MQPDDAKSIHPVLSAEHVQELYHLVGGYRISQAIYVVVKLGIPDLLMAGATSSADLAQATGTHPAALYRVMRFLAGVGIFAESAPQHFTLTALGVGLCRDVPGSLGSTVLMHLDPSKWAPWGQMLYSVQTGAPAFAHVHHMGAFDYLSQHPDAAGVFQEAMTSNTARSGVAITRAYDFAGAQRLVDIGGGHGLLLMTILAAYPAMEGVLFDRPEIAAGAAANLAAAGFATRCQVIGGDFFTSVPNGGAIYVLRHILHDWDDAHALQILKNCLDAMPPAGKVLVIERTISPDPHQALPVLQLDLEMLVNYGGLERTDEEYRVLFAAAGLRLSAVIPLSDMAGFSIYEGVPAQ